MEKLERSMIETIANNLLHCADLPNGYKTEDDMDFDEMTNFVKSIRKVLNDNVNMLYTIVDNDKQKTENCGIVMG